MRDLVPIKVKILLKDNGHAKYPNFNALNSVQSSGLDWSRYVDVYGLGWHYDKKCGHKEEDGTSPFGQQWGVLIVPKAFADEAVAMYRDEVTKLTEAQLGEFYDTRAHFHESDNIVNQTALDPFEAKKRSGKTLTAEEQAAYDKALDPDDDAPGIAKNKRRKWADFKQLVAVNIIQ